MKFRLLVIACLVTFALQTNGQENLQTETETETSKKINALSVGLYLDNGLHPGLKFGASHLLTTKFKSKKHRLNFRQKRYDNKVKEIKFLLDGNLGFYNHPNNHFGSFAGLGFTRMRMNDQNKKDEVRTFAWSFGVNYLRRFYNIETYELDSNGGIESVPFAGTNSVMFYVTPSFGKNYQLKSGKTWRFFIAPSLQFLKYNHAFFPNASLEVGATLNLFE